MRKRKIFIVLALMAVFSTNLWCNGGKEPSLPAASTVKIAFSFGAAWLDIYQAMEDMFLKAIKEYGRPIDVDFWYANGDVSREASNIQRAIAGKPDILILMPQNSTEILRSIELAHQKGIPVITYNRQQDAHPTIFSDAYVGLDTFDQGYTAAVALFKRMKENSVTIRAIIILGDLVDRNAVNRKAGFYQAAEEFEARVVAEVESFWNEKKAAELLDIVLDEHPEATCLFLSSDFMMPEIRKVLMKKGRWYPFGHPGHLYIGAQDVFKEAVEDIKNGYIDVSTAFDIWPMSVTLVQVVTSLVSGSKLGQVVFLVPGRIVTAYNLVEMEDLWSLSD